MSSNSWSTDVRPSAPSIRARSSAVCGPYGIGSSAGGDQRVVGIRVEQVIDLGRLGESHAEHPASLVRIAVDQLRLCREVAVRLDHLAADRREQVAHSLDRLDDAERGELLEAASCLGQLDEDDVPELF